MEEIKTYSKLAFNINTGERVKMITYNMRCDIAFVKDRQGREQRIEMFSKKYQFINK